MASTGYYIHRDFWKHEMGSLHPECPERLDAIEDLLIASGMTGVLARHEDFPRATAEQLTRVHGLAYVQQLEQAHRQLAGQAGYVQVDPDTQMNASTLEAAQRAAGAALAATDAVLRGELANAFCALRPPGHHACRDRAMGFCFFNNVAIAARHALEVHGLSRVAVLDFDVHHGNGTEDIFANDPRVLMVGFFQHPLYPYSGSESAASNMLNLPVPAYTRGMAVRELIETYWLPRLDAFAPQALFISAGFDAHRDDELGQLSLTEQDFAWITARIGEVARRHAGGRIVSVLEGGYNLNALARSVLAHLRVLAEL